MSEESVKMLSVDEICCMMISAIKDYLVLEKFNKESIYLKEKRADLKMLYKVITEKKIGAALTH